MKTTFGLASIIILSSLLVTMTMISPPRVYKARNVETGDTVSVMICTCDSVGDSVNLSPHKIEPGMYSKDAEGELYILIEEVDAEE